MPDWNNCPPTIIKEKEILPCGSFPFCPKCGGIHKRFTYRVSCDSYHDYDQQFRSWMAGNSTIVELTIWKIPECLEIHCASCDYMWLERPRDYEEEKKE